MKTFKFRAWHNGIMEYADDNRFPIRWTGRRTEVVSPVMLWLGEYDQKGKPIFDKDIVRDRMSGKIGVIREIKHVWRIIFTDGTEDYFGDYAAPEEDLTVIGNGFETPNLLNPIK